MIGGFGVFQLSSLPTLIHNSSVKKNRNEEHEAVFSADCGWKFRLTLNVMIMISN